MPDPRSEAERWFRQASHDLRAVRWNIEGRFFDTACFLAQQSAEKALKSLLYFLGLRRSALLTHSLVEMIQEAAPRLPRLAEAHGDARDLDLHYIPSRYPNGLPSGYPHRFYTEDVALRAAAAAERIVRLVREHYAAQGEAFLVSDE